MLKGKYCILSFPEKEKHLVLRTANDDSGTITVAVDSAVINASLSSINDTYQEAAQVVVNLSR